jgi:hypothetical protein
MPLEVFEQDADRRPFAAIPRGSRTVVEAAATARGEPTPATGVEPATRASIQTAARPRVEPTAISLIQAAAWTGVEAATRSGIQASAKFGGGAPAWTGVEAAAPLSGEAAAWPFIVIANPHALLPWSLVGSHKALDTNRMQHKNGSGPFGRSRLLCPVQAEGRPLKPMSLPTRYLDKIGDATGQPLRAERLEKAALS